MKFLIGNFNDFDVVILLCLMMRHVINFIINIFIDGTLQ